MSLFYLKSYEREQLQNWLVSILPSWTDADPRSAALSIIMIVASQADSFQQLKEKLQKHLAMFMAESIKFVDLLFNALTYMNVTKASPDKQELAYHENASKNFYLQQSANNLPEQISNNFSFEFSNLPKMKSLSNNRTNDQRIGEFFPSSNEGHHYQTHIDAHAFNSSPLSQQEFAKESEILYRNFRYDHTTALIIKRIPPSLYHVPILLEHFRQFGLVVWCELNFRNEPNSALVQFSKASEATEAVRSNKAVCGNPFIQVLQTNELTGFKRLTSAIVEDLSNVYPLFDKINQNFPDDNFDDDSIFERPKQEVPDVFGESIVTSNKIPDSPPKPTTLYLIIALKQILQQIEELVAHRDRSIKQLEEVTTVSEKEAIMYQLEFDLIKIAFLKRQIQQLYHE